MTKQQILVIVGPTASGKSALAVELAKQFNGEVVSADSRQVYRGLNIGTGKITKKEMRGVPHHLLDIASPKKTFSAHDYVIHATDAVVSVACRGKLPIIVGGTGFYIDALVGRIVLPDVPPDKKLRARLSKKTPAQLFAMLKKLDPARARTIEKQNPVRLIRAIEIAFALGHIPLMDLRSPSFDALWVGIAPPMKKLEQKIAIRLFARMRRGMIREAKRLHMGGLSYTRMKELGLEYRSLARYLQKDISKKEMTEELELDIRRYAKKQLTYWKRNKEIRWFAPAQKKAIVKSVRTWLR